MRSRGRRRTGSTVRLPGVLALLAAMAAIPLAGSLDGQVRGAQQRQRTTQQRTTPRGTPQTDRSDRQGALLLDRVAQRVGRALHLDDDQIRRLQRELQVSRMERARINAQARAVRQELAHLIQESDTDETRIEALLNEALELEVAAARVAIDEQRRLAEFMTPIQRARALWLRQRLAREALQRDRPPDSP